MTEIRELRNEVKKSREDISKGILAITEMMGEEHSFFKQELKDHTDHDNRMFEELGVSHKDIIVLLAESKEDRKALMNQVVEVQKTLKEVQGTVKDHNNLVQRGKGLLGAGTLILFLIALLEFIGHFK